MPKFTGTTTVPFAADEIDLETWLYNMSDQEYQRVGRQRCQDCPGQGRED